MRGYTWVLMVSLGLSGTGPCGAAGPPPQLPPYMIVPDVVIGKLLRIEGNVYVVKDDEGKEHRLDVSRHETLIDKDIRVGDKVTAEVFQDGRARSVVKAPQ
jgi:hypothetical protein